MGRVDWEPEQQQGECVLGLLQFRADSGSSGKQWDVDADYTGDGRETGQGLGLQGTVVWRVSTQLNTMALVTSLGRWGGSREKDESPRAKPTFSRWRK